MPQLRHLLLVNPTITSRRSARFPLAALNLSAALDGRYTSTILDGNVDRDFVATALKTIETETIDAVGVSVMGGPQLRTALALSQAVRARFPHLPIIWGGHFPTICAAACLAEACVDFAIRGQGEDTFLELLDALFDRNQDALPNIDGVSWRAGGDVIHNRNRPFSAAGLARELPFERLGDPRRYLGRTYLGRRTAGYQAALGCRFRCTFCGVAAMFRGRTALPPAQRLQRDLRYMRDQLGADSIQFYDHNFFDREQDTLPLLEVLADIQLPWWCFARSDALLNLSAQGWAQVRKSRLSMAYIGAESPSDWLLHDIRKGTKKDQTLDVVEKCRSNGVIPNCPSCSHRHRIRRARPSEPLSSSARSNVCTHARRSCCTSTRPCPRRRAAPIPTWSARSPIYAARMANRCSFPPAPGNGLSSHGWSTGATRTPRGSHRNCVSGSRISPPCSVAVFQPSLTCAPRCGASPR